MIDQASLNSAVERFSALPGVVDASIVSHDGLIMTSTSSDQDLNDVIGAMSSEIVAKGKQTITELQLGELWGNALFGSTGAILTRTINEEMLLLVRVTPQAQLAETFDKMNNVVTQLSIE